MVLDNFRRAVFTPLILAVGFIGYPHSQASAFETSALQAAVVDMQTGATLLQKDADTAMFPASMTKMMTAYMLFERIKTGGLSLEDTFPVSEKAWRKGGSKMFVKVGDRVKVEDLIRGIVVQSGNDATIVVAEGIAGSESAFADLMTEKAHELGMSGTTFRNASGWPDPEHVTTARDLATLAVATIRNFPDLYKYYSEKSFTYNNIKQGNRNPLLYKGVGADGLKTGHTEASGYGLTGSAARNGRRLVVVVNGLMSVKARSSESERIIDWAYRSWGNYKLFSRGEKVIDANVWLGVKETAPVLIQNDLLISMPRKARKKMKVSVKMQDPIPAPVVAGAKIATLVVAAPDFETIEIPLVAGITVKRLGPVGRLNEAVRHLVWGNKN
ncbi:MAG: D-alanyl-D-alanine carboxypeptidase [Rhodospirillaceae bacterium]|jgi:serine-type D-Ala-D-Ala carboxypeptidase (penicillin-binding protein 5/6)|nr:D-alanyl-D-alanine carboxypeptidase [Rhodospirillaceae bacterium]MBT5664523.1 D-alanyl-D-alanine carboxypeptidase [Rhodospirillaceae bacterium]